MVNFLKIFEKFFCTDCVGHSNCVSVFALTGRLLSLHRLTGALELPQAGSPLTGGSFFQHRPTGALELPQAGSPFPGGEFSAEPQRGIRRLRTAGTCRAPRQGKRVDTYGFYPLNSRFPLFLSLAQIADM